MAKQKKRADGRYCKNVTIGRNENGSLKRKMIYANTQKELDLKVAELTLQADKGLIIDDKNKTVDIWADEWLKTYKRDFKSKTILTYKSIIKKYIKPNFQNIRLKDLKQYQIMNVLNEIENESVPGKFLSAMNQMLDCAVNNDYISKNVAKGLKVSKYYSKSKRPLTNDEIKIIKNTPHEIQNVCLFLMYSGLRINELINLKWKDIDFKTRKISIYGDVKTKSSNRNVPIVQPLNDLLKNLEKTNIKNIDSEKDYIFKFEGNSFDINRLTRLRYEYCELCGIDFTFHQFRHTCASMLYYADVGIKEAQEWLGHASAKVTMDIYTHLKEQEKETATDKIDKYLKSI